MKNLEGIVFSSGIWYENHDVGELCKKSYSFCGMCNYCIITSKNYIYSFKIFEKIKTNIMLYEEDIKNKIYESINLIYLLNKYQYYIGNYYLHMFLEDRHYLNTYVNKVGKLYYKDDFNLNQGEELLFTLAILSENNIIVTDIFNKITNTLINNKVTILEYDNYIIELTTFLTKFDSIKIDIKNNEVINKYYKSLLINHIIDNNIYYHIHCCYDSEKCLDRCNYMEEVSDLYHNYRNNKDNDNDKSFLEYFNLKFKHLNCKNCLTCSYCKTYICDRFYDSISDSYKISKCSVDELLNDNNCCNYSKLVYTLEIEKKYNFFNILKTNICEDLKYYTFEQDIERFEYVYIYINKSINNINLNNKSIYIEEDYSDDDDYYQNMKATLYIPICIEKNEYNLYISNVFPIGTYINKKDLFIYLKNNKDKFLLSKFDFN